MHGDAAEFYRIPESRELAAQYLLLYEMSLPFGLDLNNQINIDKSATRLTVTLADVTSKEIVAASEKAEQWLRQNAPAAMFTYGTGASVMFARISEINIKSMIKGGLLGLILISGILVFALRDVKIGLLSLIPNLLPIVMAFGLWGLISGKVNTAIAVVIGMTMGIIVDDTIHFLSKYLRARREKRQDVTAAIHYAFANVGHALVVTTIVLVVGFSILSFSGFAMNSSMAKLTVITIILALLADFLILPALLMQLGGVRLRKSWGPGGV